MSGYTNKTWICPFYKRDEKMAMVCEGNVRVAFDIKSDLMEYQKNYCGSFDYFKCPIAERILKEYGQEQETD